MHTTRSLRQLSLAGHAPGSVTLALLKPDLLANPQLPAHIINNYILADPQPTSMPNDSESDSAAMRALGGFKILAERDVLWTQAEAEAFYAEHKNRFFFERLCGYMTSGPFKALVLSKPNAIADWRALIGPTHPVRARIYQPHTLRALYGLTDTRNSFHGSDAHSTALAEIKHFF